MKHYRLRWALLALLAALALATTGFGPPTLIESDAATTPVSPQTLRLLKADRPPQIVASAAAVIDPVAGQVVFEKNSHERRAMASTTKMMTALVTLENAQLDAVVTAGPNVKVEPSIIGLDPGDQLTVEQLLYGLMLPSGNDAAVDLAEYVGGSMPQFASMMNAKAAQMGLKDTHFVTPHGLDADEHYSSAYDLAMIARAGLDNPVFAKIVGTREFRVQGPVRWMFRNNNQLLATYPGADGVKTGYTDNAGRCLVSTASRNGQRAIAVVLDSADTYGDSAALLDYYFNNYTRETLSATGVPLGEYGQEGDIRHAVAKVQPQIAVANWQRPYLRWFFSIAPDSSQGDGVIGKTTFYLFGKKVAEIELYDEGS